MKNYLVSFKCNGKIIKSVAIRTDMMINALQTFMEMSYYDTYDTIEILSIIKFE